MALRALFALVAGLAVGGAQALAAEAPLIVNGGFEAVKQAKPGADGLVSGWKLGEPPEVPESWSLNSAYPGELAVSTDRPHGGERCVRLTARPDGSAHLYQVVQGLEPGKWYRVSAWARRGTVIVDFYEYFADGHMSGQRGLQGRAPADEWRRFTGFYHTPTEGYLRSALAVCAPNGQSVEVDDVTLEVVELGEAPRVGTDITFENEAVRLTLGGEGSLKELRCKRSGLDYSAGPVPVGVLTATRQGTPTPVASLVREGDRVKAQFLDSDVKATLRVVPRKHHFLIEVLDVQPADVEQLGIDFPVKRLATEGWAFNAIYNDQFGVCFFATTVNGRNLGLGLGGDVRSLRCACYAAHGLAGTKFALVAAPFDEFKAAIIEAERANDVPCPMLDGKWARDSDPVRRSYLFAVSVTEADIDTLIQYAKLGGFGTIIILKDSWLANHGHFDVNQVNFPGGREALRRAVQKIHAAGLDAGVHVFGPSISPNDPYITPRPDDRLAFVLCPPLAEDVDEKATTLTLTDQPNLPPRTVRTRAFPGYYLRVGDEIIRYLDVEVGPPFRFVGCQRGALGTQAVAHEAGEEVKGLLSLWGFFLVDPDSTLADELTSNFADVFNYCDFDMVYFDASDGIQDDYLDRRYYLNKLHVGFYRKFKKDVLYQTSNGTGTDLCWHLIPRSASADGHGDIKGYLDERWPGILGMAANFTRADIGWYYMFKDVRPDQIEYVCAKALGVDGSISIEASRASLESLPQARQVFEMISRYERCRLAGYFPEVVRAKLREPQKDFKLFEDGKDGWRLYRAAYEEPRPVDVLDGEQNVWGIRNDLERPCLLGVEIVRGETTVSPQNYEHEGALLIEGFDSPDEYRASERNDFPKFVVGDHKTMTETGPVRAGFTQRWHVSTADTKVGKQGLVYEGRNDGDPGGWGGIGRRFAQPLDLSRFRGLGLWIHGDGKGETIRVQLRDTAGRSADFLPVMNYLGWRLHIFSFPVEGGFDPAKVEYLLFYFNSVPGKTDVRVVLDEVRALPELTPPGVEGWPVLSINRREVALPTRIELGQALSSEGPGGTKLWPGRMEPGRPVAVPPDALTLPPGENRIVLSWGGQATFPGNLTVLLYRLWPMESE